MRKFGVSLSIMAAGIVKDGNVAAHYVVGNKSNQDPQGDICTQDIQGEAGTQFLTSNHDPVGVVAGPKGKPASIKIGSVLIGELEQVL
ncbi:hypothetical protein [Commensalibacter papalotli (ex Botero et al. 2024)]|uniref:Uncharacterized protein n=2 Tax=Commensalibacter papalotli (ex Botero et al. 2024) TaxID=2972766 RepID=A0ABN8WDG8_9PROT|nr:hypothetical protein [Commensalibacter papalotli (ex Botero et al. 2024)]CAI3931506.1 unnamed protein product [Commensalibacter papalotli (ex Botero et al. 2024)]CAI3944148.1 unnamed protein product [Commensalibacter papalotli (ex Botero et al. 2024)]